MWHFTPWRRAVVAFATSVISGYSDRICSAVHTNSLITFMPLNTDLPAVGEKAVAVPECTNLLFARSKDILKVCRKSIPKIGLAIPAVIKP